MLRFLKWRKMTWVLVAWNGAIAAWVLVLLASSSAAAGCSVDAGGAAVSGLARQDCLDSVARGFGVPLVALIWAVGLVVFSVVWYSTRPLWRQGHGARFRRLRSEDFYADADPGRTPAAPRPTADRSGEGLERAAAPPLRVQPLPRTRAR